MAPIWSHWWILDKNLQKIYLCLSVALHVKWKGMPIYSAKRRLKFTFNLRYISLYCLLLLIVAPTLPIEVFFLFSYCSRVNLPARKKKKLEWGWLRGCTVQPEVRFPEFWHHWVVCVVVFLRFCCKFSLRLFLIGSECSGLSNYLSFFVVCVLANSCYEYFIWFYASNIKSMLTNSVGLCECACWWVCLLWSFYFGFFFGKKTLIYLAMYV